MREQAVAVWYDPDGCEVVQREMFTCPHCNRGGFLGQDDGGYCIKCQKPLCKQDVCYDDCTPVASMFGYGDDKTLAKVLARNRSGVLIG